MTVVLIRSSRYDFYCFIRRLKGRLLAEIWNKITIRIGANFLVYGLACHSTHLARSHVFSPWRCIACTKIFFIHQQPPLRHSVNVMTSNIFSHYIKLPLNKTYTQVFACDLGKNQLYQLSTVIKFSGWSPLHISLVHPVWFTHPMCPAMFETGIHTMSIIYIILYWGLGDIWERVHYSSETNPGTTDCRRTPNAMCVIKYNILNNSKNWWDEPTHETLRPPKNNTAVNRCCFHESNTGVKSLN